MISRKKKTIGVAVVVAIVVLLTALAECPMPGSPVHLDPFIKGAVVEHKFH